MAEVKEKLREAFGSAPDTLPPHSVEAEEAVLGSMLLDPYMIDEIASIVTQEDFFIVRNGWVYAALIALYQREENADYLLLLDELKKAGQLEDAGGPAYITHLMNHTPSTMHGLAYAHLVQRAADRRRLIDYHRAALERAWNEDTPIQTLYAEDLHCLTTVKPRALDQALTSGDTIEARFMELQSEGDQAVKVFPLPFGEPDQALPYMTGGKLFGIGGDEKTGKTALAETLSEHWARLGKKGFYIHTEEKPDAKIIRRYSRWSGIPFLKLEAGRLDPDDYVRRERALEYARPWTDNLHLWYESLPSADRIVGLIRRAVQVFGAEFVVLDNFTDVDFSSRNRNDSQAQAAKNLLQQIDDLAAKEGILVVLVTQMTTQPDGKRIAFGTSGFNKKMTWFWDINRKSLKDPFEYDADGTRHRLEAGAFDPRVDIFVPASRYGSGAKIEVFADLRRFYWRGRHEITLQGAPPPKITHWTERAYDEPDEPAQIDLAGF